MSDQMLINIVAKTKLSGPNMKIVFKEEWRAQSRLDRFLIFLPNPSVYRNQTWVPMSDDETEVELVE